ncbi:hypothetical protein EXN66_Car011222 [Channa argus]|uniref:Uncharacterized protein n=1 Tax=Channa argus TaxID=215402 RepID=A0A6G1PZZ7_CHAAH|nr:hypothetical protein EXN66_Car011222 [Channa argus]
MLNCSGCSYNNQLLSFSSKSMPECTFPRDVVCYSDRRKNIHLIYVKKRETFVSPTAVYHLPQQKTTLTKVSCFTADKNRSHIERTKGSCNLSHQRPSVPS